MLILQLLLPEGLGGEGWKLPNKIFYLSVSFVLEVHRVRERNHLPLCVVITRYANVSEKLPHQHGEGVSFSCSNVSLSEKSYISVKQDTVLPRL
jgi:hypothetical protein